MPTAVLFSAGLDSAVLAAAEAQRVPCTRSMSVTAWRGIRGARSRGPALATPAFQSVRPARAPDLYRAGPLPRHALGADRWPPAFDTPDEDVYLTGRNVMLLNKAGIYCAQHDLNRIVLATLSSQPVPDATPAFFETMGRALSLGLNHPIEIAVPFAALHKSDVIQLGVKLGVPLRLTLSCMNPQLGLHCGLCSKCRTERRDAFHDAAIEDLTEYDRAVAVVQAA